MRASHETGQGLQGSRPARYQWWVVFSLNPKRHNQATEKNEGCPGRHCGTGNGTHFVDTGDTGRRRSRRTGCLCSPLQSIILSDTARYHLGSDGESSFPHGHPSFQLKNLGGQLARRIEKQLSGRRAGASHRNAKFLSQALHVRFGFTIEQPPAEMRSEQSAIRGALSLRLGVGGSPCEARGGTYRLPFPCANVFVLFRNAPHKNIY